MPLIPIPTQAGIGYVVTSATAAVVSNLGRPRGPSVTCALRQPRIAGRDSSQSSAHANAPFPDLFSVKRKISIAANPRRWIPIFRPEIKKKYGLGESARASALRDLWAARSTEATWRALSIRRLSEVARSADPVCDSSRSEEAGCCAMSLTREVDVQCRGLPIRISEKSIA